MRATVLILLLVLAAPTAGAQELVKLAEVGPWPFVSRLIAYRGRVWFANAVRYPDHNSADLYNYDPADGRVRYQRHLFSQDVGQPVVADGLLYWPNEGARVSMGWGQFAVTNGRDWRLGVLPTAASFHTFAMAEMDGRLYAAGSAWRATISVSGDGGATWRLIYDRPTPKRRVSRITELEVLGGVLYGTVVDRLADGTRRTLISLTEGEVALVPGWPANNFVTGLTPWRGWLYGIVSEGAGNSVWRTDGRRSERMTPSGLSFRDLAAGDDGLWAVGAMENGGALWHSADGRDWRLTQTLAGGTPMEVMVMEGRIFAAGTGNNGKGILWGPQALAAAPTASAPPPLPPIPPGPAVDWNDAGRSLDALFADGDGYRNMRSNARGILWDVARADPPPEFLETRLAGPFPDRIISRSGGSRSVAAADIARWSLFWTMGIAGAGRVPVEFLGEPWTLEKRRSEKYTHVVPGAMWSIAWTGQHDRATVSALVARLGRSDDPYWLNGDVVGALSVATGQRFAYDFDAWRDWWALERNSWPAFASK